MFHPIEHHLTKLFVSYILIFYFPFPSEAFTSSGDKVSDEEWSDEVYNELGDERQNLNKDVNGVIIAFGDLGLWNGDTVQNIIRAIMVRHTASYIVAVTVPLCIILCRL